MDFLKFLFYPTGLHFKCTVRLKSHKLNSLMVYQAAPIKTWFDHSHLARSSRSLSNCPVKRFCSLFRFLTACLSCSTYPNDNIIERLWISQNQKLIWNLCCISKDLNFDLLISDNPSWQALPSWQRNYCGYLVVIIILLSYIRSNIFIKSHRSSFSCWPAMLIFRDWLFHRKKKHFSDQHKFLFLFLK